MVCADLTPELEDWRLQGRSEENDGVSLAIVRERYWRGSGSSAENKNDMSKPVGGKILHPSHPDKFLVYPFMMHDHSRLALVKTNNV